MHSARLRRFRFRRTADRATYRACHPPSARDPAEPPPTRSYLACRRRPPTVLAVIPRTPPLIHIRTAQHQLQQSHGYVPTTDGRDRNGPRRICRCTECFEIGEYPHNNINIIIITVKSRLDFEYTITVIVSHVVYRESPIYEPIIEYYILYLIY